DMQNTVDGGCGSIETSAVGNSTLCVADRNHEPYEGMLFESEDAARAYYDEYAERIGFATRILSSRKSERDGSIISRGLGCRGIPDNHRSDTILNEKGEKRREICTAMIVVKRDKPGRWIVRKFVRDHNHPLVISLSKKRPTFDEKDKKIQELTAELRVKKRLSASYRDQLLTLMKDVENHNDHLTEKVQIVRNNLKELEAKRQHLLDHIQPRS
ncbi:FAR1-RELATED SEQUENCE 2-like, partial [Olea europaea subsp. europaea]